MVKLQVNAPIERDGKQYQVGEEFDASGMKVQDVRLLVQAGVLLAVETIAPNPIVEEEETWQEQQ